MIHSFSRAAGRVLAIGAAVLATAVMTGAQTATTSEVRGRVFNASSGRNLNNARVTVKGTTIEGFTDASGEYRLQVPPGEVELAVNYTGLAAQTARVTVHAAATVRQDFELDARSAPSRPGDIAVLDAFSVSERRLSAGPGPERAALRPQYQECRHGRRIR